MYEETKETWAKDVNDFFTKIERRQGCSDHSCFITPPKGQGTNGGCSCLKTLRQLKRAYNRLFPETT